MRRSFDSLMRTQDDRDGGMLMLYDLLSGRVKTLPYSLDANRSQG